MTNERSFRVGITETDAPHIIAALRKLDDFSGMVDLTPEQQASTLDFRYRLEMALNDFTRRKVIHNIRRGRGDGVT